MQLAGKVFPQIPVRHHSAHGLRFQACFAAENTREGIILLPQGADLLLGHRLLLAADKVVAPKKRRLLRILRSDLLNALFQIVAKLLLRPLHLLIGAEPHAAPHARKKMSEMPDQFLPAGPGKGHMLRHLFKDDLGRRHILQALRHALFAPVCLVGLPAPLIILQEGRDIRRKQSGKCALFHAGISRLIVLLQQCCGTIGQRDAAQIALREITQGKIVRKEKLLPEKLQEPLHHAVCHQRAELRIHHFAQHLLRAGFLLLQLGPLLLRDLILQKEQLDRLALVDLPAIGLQVQVLVQAGLAPCQAEDIPHGLQILLVPDESAISRIQIQQLLELPFQKEKDAVLAPCLEEIQNQSVDLRKLQIDNIGQRLEEMQVVLVPVQSDGLAFLRVPTYGNAAERVEELCPELSLVRLLEAFEILQSVPVVGLHRLPEGILREEVHFPF